MELAFKVPDRPSKLAEFADMHGQITGENFSSAQLEKDVTILVERIATIASAAENEFGYDGMQRNTYSKAKSTSKIAVQK